MNNNLRTRHRYFGILLILFSALISVYPQSDNEEEKVDWSPKKFHTKIVNCLASGEIKCLDALTNDEVFLQEDIIYFVFKKKLKKTVDKNKVKDLRDFVGTFEDFHNLIISKDYHESYFSGLYEMPDREFSFMELARTDRRSFWSMNYCSLNSIALEKKKKERQACIGLNTYDSLAKYTIFYHCKNFKKELGCKITGIGYY